MLLANCFISTEVTSVIMPRPYCAAAPEICRSWSTATLVPPPEPSLSLAVTFSSTLPRPCWSEPDASRTIRLASSSRSATCALPANASLTGPIRRFTVPAYSSSPRSSVSSAPGRQAATPGTSWKNSQTLSTGCDTSNSLLTSIVVRPPDR